MGDLLIHGHVGLGDQIYMRPFVLELVRQWEPRVHKAYLATPWPELYWDHPELGFVAVGEGLRCQRENIAAQPPGTFSGVPAPGPGGGSVRLGYGRGVLRGADSIAQEMTRAVPGMGEVSLKLPLDPAWQEAARDYRAGFRPSRKWGVKARLNGRKLGIIRPPTVRREWESTSRNPHLEYFQRIVDEYREGWYWLGVGNLKQGEEWFPGPFGRLDGAALHGELHWTTLLALLPLADAVVTSPTWLVPAAMATNAPTFVIFGGSLPPGVFIDGANESHLIQYVAPEPFCYCKQRNHSCRKDIPWKNIQSTFEAYLESRKTSLSGSPPGATE